MEENSVATFKDLEDLMKRLLALDPPGVAVSVARHGGVLYEGYFGTMDLAGTRPIAPDTLYRLYSMTKPIGHRHAERYAGILGGGTISENAG